VRDVIASKSRAITRKQIDLMANLRYLNPGYQLAAPRREEERSG